MLHLKSVFGTFLKTVCALLGKEELRFSSGDLMLMDVLLLSGLPSANALEIKTGGLGTFSITVIIRFQAESQLLLYQAAAKASHHPALHPALTCLFSFL